MHVLRSNRQIEKLKTFKTFKMADFVQMIGPDTPECNFRLQIHWKTRSIGVQENVQRSLADLPQLLIFVAFPYRRTPFGVSPRMRPHWKGDRESPARRKQDYFKLRIFPEAMIAGCSDDPRQRKSWPVIQNRWVFGRTPHSERVDVSLKASASAVSLARADRF
jgi:hypothetical protein